MKTRDDSLLLDENSPSWTLGGADHLPYKISLVAKLLDRKTTRMLAEEFGLSVAEWRVLAQLATCESSSVRDLAEKAWVDRAEVSRATASLVRRGYVKRHDNPDDRRGPLLSSTKSGQALFKKIKPRRAAFHKSLTSKLERTQISALEKALLTLAQLCVVELKKEAAPAGRVRARAAKA
jgi:DNA-binding MarR family transcriptional regulator